MHTKTENHIDLTHFYRGIKTIQEVATIEPLGAGQEVGRSCISLQYKDRTILLDCGLHPGYVF